MILLRSLAFAAWSYGLTAIMCILYLPLRLLAPRYTFGFAQAWGRVMLAGVRHLLRIDWAVSGLEHMPADRPALLASMHQSAFDTVIWTRLAPRFAYVMKVELTRVPIAGMILVRSGMIPVDRRGGPAAMRTLLRDADRALAEGRQIIIFPEGTRVAHGEQMALQPGVAALAARTGLDVIPVVTDSGRLWGRRAFLIRPGTIHIRLLPPLSSGLRRDDLMTQLRDAFRRGVAELAEPVDNSVHS